MSSSDEEFELNYGFEDEQKIARLKSVDNDDDDYEEEEEEDAKFAKLNEHSMKVYSKNPKSNQTETENDPDQPEENDNHEEENDDDAPLEDLLNLIEQNDQNGEDNAETEPKSNDSEEFKPVEISEEGRKIKLKRDKQPSVEAQTPTSTGSKSSITISKIKKPESSTIVPTSGDSQPVFVEKYSGIRVTNSPYKSELELNVQLSSNYGKFFSLSRLYCHQHELKEQKDAKHDWFTVFLIGSKTETKCSARGNQYIVWHVYDLNNLEKPQEVSLFLFGNAYKAHWKSNEYEAFALVKPEFLDSNRNVAASAPPTSNKYFDSNMTSKSLLKPNNKSSNWNNFASKKLNLDNKITLSINNESQLVRIGLAKDIGYCQAMIGKAKWDATETAKKCKSLVDLQRAPVCTFHCMQQEKGARKKTGSLTPNPSAASKKYSMDKPFMTPGERSSFTETVKFTPNFNLQANINTLKQKEHTMKTAKDLKSEIVRSLSSSIMKETLASSPAYSNAMLKSSNKKSDLEILALLDGKEIEKEELRKIKLAEQQATMVFQSGSGKNNEVGQELKKFFAAKLGDCTSGTITSQKMLELRKSNNGQTKSELEKANELRKNYALAKMKSHRDILKEIKEQKKDADNPETKPEKEKENAVSDCQENEDSNPTTKSTNESEKANKLLASDFLKKRIEEIKKFSPSQSAAATNSPKSKPVAAKPAAAKVDTGFDLELYIGDSKTSLKLMDAKSKYKPGPAKVDVEDRKRKLDKDDGEADEDAKSKKLKLIDELLNVKSNHAKDVFDADKNPHYRAFLNRLEQEEKVHEKLCSMRNREVKVVSCSQCAYTAFSQSDFCKLKRHQIERHTVLQRFFKCKSCNRRTHTLDKIVPVASCVTCGSDKFEPCTYVDDKADQSGHKFNIDF